MPTSSLEKRLTDWLRVEAGWLMNDLDRQPQRRTIGYLTDEYSAHLIEGGQWLLTFNKYGRGPIYAYDLGAPTYPKIKLIELTTPCVQLQVSIQVLDTFPRLEFVLAALCNVTLNGPARLEIWKVVASNTVYGRVLSATLLTSLATGLDICSTIDLRDNLFVGDASMHQLEYISIIDWPRSSSLALCEATIYPKTVVRMIKLLPDGRIFTIGSRAVYIYQHVPCCYGSLPKYGSGLYTSPIQSLELPYTQLTYTITPPYTDRAGVLHILFGTSYGVMQVSLPERLEDAQLLFAHALPPCFYNFTRYRIIIRYYVNYPNECRVFTGCLRRSKRADYNVPLSDWPTLHSRGLRPVYLDEVSGKVVETDEKGRLFVIDYKVQ
ncbi:hypothetical protein ONZ45_g10626 [Pleurotus djamor]|nr:hypothetical protein ONZ45_g10626 [Pleurotus djamor]